MNAYQRREAQREALRKARSNERKSVTLEDAEVRCRKFERAFKEFMQSVGFTVECQMFYNKGWYFASKEGNLRAHEVDARISGYEVLTHQRTNPHLEIQDE